MNFENVQRPQNPEAGRRENVVKTLLEALESSGFQADFQGESAEHRKQALESISKRMPEIGDRFLSLFKELSKKEGLDPGKLSFFVVGGRVRATPIKENTDFDVVIAAEKPLSPFAKRETISMAQRHAIGRALYDKTEEIFQSFGLEKEYERGIIEFKGFGERTAAEVEGGEGVLKITEIDDDPA